jgi:tRNA modification GTPase
VQILDTAGIREAHDQVERLGIERSRSAAQGADLVLLTVDAYSGWTADDQRLYETVQHRPLIVVINKMDLVTEGDMTPLPPLSVPLVYTAAAHNQGIDHLEAAILKQVRASTFSVANVEALVNQRQAAALTRAMTALEQVQTTIADGLPLDFWTIDLRMAIHALGEVTGDDVTESMLDEIFSRFCIGK